MNEDAVDDIAKASTLLQALVKDLHQNQSIEERVSELTDRITSLVEKMGHLAFDRTVNNSLMIHIHGCAVTLWNVAVAMKTSGHTGAVLDARLRYAACILSFLANATDTSEVTFRKQLVMFTKTGRAWLDCENPKLADECLASATECWVGLQKIWSSKSQQDMETAEQGKQIAECERYMFRVYCFRAEAAFSSNHQEEARSYVHEAKEFLARLPVKESATLAILCYNFGVDTYYREDFENCISWLRASYDLGKGKKALGAKKQATTLRLMANAYLDWDSKKNWQLALNAVDLANSEHSHAAGLYLKAKLLLMCGEDQTVSSSRLQSAFEETLQHPDLKVDLGLCTVNLAVQHNRTELAFDCLKILANRFKNSPELYKVQLEYLELLLKNKQDQSAKELIEDCIVGHIGRSVDDEMRQRFHILIWDKAAAAYEEKDYIEALNWYNYSLSLFTSKEANKKGIGKLQRNKCGCFMNLQDFEKAKDALDESERCDPDCPVIYFYKFKIALLEGEDDLATEAMTKMNEIGSKQEKNITETDAHGLICVAAQLALEQKNHKVAVCALERVIETSHDHQQVLTSLRCLARLKLTQTAETGARSKEYFRTFLHYLQIALDHLKLASEAREAIVQTEATWFMKIAWNLALESTESICDMQNLFLLCYKFSCLCPVDSANLIRQKNCLVMAAASAVQAAREMKNDRVEKMKLLRQCLEHVETCRTLSRNIGIGGNTSQKDEAAVLLTLYEFEAKTQLGDSDLSTCLDTAEALPHTDPSTFESLAALAVEPPVYYREVSMRALRIAIRKHLAMDTCDFSKLSHAFHSLVHHALSSGSSSDPESKMEALEIYQDICEIIEKQSKGSYPEVQILWLMTKAWNCGINLFSAGKYEAGEKWCALAMRLLHHLTAFKCNYQEKVISFLFLPCAREKIELVNSAETLIVFYLRVAIIQQRKMTKVYGDMLEQIEKNATKTQVEE